MSNDECYPVHFRPRYSEEESSDDAYEKDNRHRRFENRYVFNGMVHTFTSVLQCFLFETRTPTTFMHTCSIDYSTQEKEDLYSVTNDCIHVCGWNSYTSLSIFHWQHEK